MRVKVIKEFVDRHTGVLHNCGSTFDCDDKRFNEIESAGHFVEPAPVIEKEKKKDITE